MPIILFVGLVVFVATSSDAHSAYRSMAVMALGVLSIVSIPLGLIAGVVWWRGTDEAMREAHKWAWFWGATFGITAFMVPALGFAFAPDVYKAFVAFATGGTGRGEFYLGAAVLMLLQAAGYLIAWLFWWSQRR